jgi:hypothetical protein
MTTNSIILLVSDGQQTRTHARTQIRITDLGSSRGTTVDGEQIKGQERVLSGDEHIVQLGRAPDALRYVIRLYVRGARLTVLQYKMGASGIKFLILL